MNPMNWDAPLALIVAALFVIVFLRATGTYFLGRGIVAGTARSRWGDVVESRPYKVGSSWLNRWGAPAVTLCFVTVGVQTAVLLSAGISRMPYRKFFLALVPGCVMWALIYGTVGFVGFKALAALWEVSPVLTVVIGALAILAIIIGLRAVGRKQRTTLVDEPLPTPELPAETA